MRPLGSAGKILPALIEINVGGEKAKSGVAPDSANWSKFCKVRRAGAICKFTA